MPIDSRVKTAADVVSALWRRMAAWRNSLLGGALVLSLMGVSVTPFWRGIELKGFDLLSVITAPEKSTLPIVLVGIDDASLAELKLRWPWPRSMHARLTDALKQAGAAVIVFDVVFEYPSEKSEDDALADAIRRAGNVVLAAGIVKQETAHGTSWTRQDPLPAFREAGGLAGLVNLEFDRDQVMRRIPDSAEALWRRIATRLQVALPEAVMPRPPQKGDLIRYLGPTGTFPRVSYYQALDPARNLPPGELANTVVIVGRDTRAASDIGSAQLDTFATPYTSFGGELMPGMEIHATILENALGGHAITPAPTAANLGLLIVTSLLALVAMRSFRPLVTGLVALLLTVVLALAAWGLFVYSHVWLAVGMPIVGIGSAYVMQSLLAFMVERHRRLEVKRMFSRYVPTEVVEELAAHPERLTLGGEHRELTIMFTDLANFTTISERIEPKQAAALLNRYLTDMNEIIFRHAGTVVNIMGDGIMAFWNAPLKNPAHAINAVRAAVDMQSAMHALRAKLLADGLAPVHMRIGINTGIALLGNMGSDYGRIIYTAIGDTVNLAARLEGANKLYGTDILLSGETTKQLDGTILLRWVDLVRVKGKSQAVEVLTPCANASLVAMSDAAIDAYRRRDWDAAHALWKKVLDIAPGDTLAPLYLEWIDAYRKAPPPDDWDGSSSLDSK
jgi:adenylate cyclase